MKDSLFQDTPSFAELGALLKEQREAQGWSLQEVSAQTRLDLQVLEHLELGQLDVPPGPVFLRGFLRTYLQFLQIEASQLTRFQELLTNQATSPASKPEPATEKNQTSREAKPGSRTWISALILLTAGLLIWSLAPWQTPEAPREPVRSEATNLDPPVELTSPSPPVPPPATPKVPAPVAKTVTKPPPPPLPEVPVAPATNVATPAPIPPTPVAEEPDQPTEAEVIEEVEELPPAAPTYLTLQLQAEAAVWVVVQADENAPELLQLETGEVRSWETAQQYYVVSLGDARRVQIRLNDRVLSPPNEQQLQLDWQLGPQEN